METPHAFNNLFPIPLTKGSYLPFISEFQDLGAQVYLLEIELGIGVFVGGRTLTNLLPINNSICSIVHWFFKTYLYVKFWFCCESFKKFCISSLLC